MEITYLGHSSFKLKGKSACVVTDPYSEKLGKFPRDVTADIVTISHDHFDHNASKLVGSGFVVEGPGEYEVKGVSVVGIHSWHDDTNGSERGANTICVIEIDGLRIAHLGDLGQKLTQSQLEEMGAIDIVFVPVGGVYTIDAKLAAEVVKQIDPWVAIPMHYKQLMTDLGGVEDFLKEMAKPDVVAVPKFTISADRMPTEMQVVVLERK